MTEPNEPVEPITVFILDDHEVVRRGIAALVDAEPDMTVTGQAATANAALAVIAQTAPRVAVLDVRLTEGNGIEVCRDIRAAHPDVACLMLTSFPDGEAALDAALAGAAGFVLKQIRGNQLVAAIRSVAAGDVLIDPATVRRELAQLASGSSGRVQELSSRELEVFELIGHGYSNREIAENLSLAEKTVRNYVSNMLAKLGMKRRTEAAVLAARVDEQNRARRG